MWDGRGEVKEDDMERRSNKRMAPFPETDSVALAVAERTPSEAVPGEATPTEERYRALIAAHVETLTQLSDLQLEYSRLLNAATRAQQEVERLRAQQEVERLRAQQEVERLRALEHEAARLHEVGREVADLNLKLGTLWRNGVAQADEARRYAASLESRLDRVNRSLVQRVLRRITGKVA